jgi:hypothetical protein
MIDPINFMDLKRCDPAEVTLRTGCSYDGKTEQYRISILAKDYVVDLNKNEIRRFQSVDEIQDEYLGLFILFYLMKVRDIPVSGVWVSEKDITGGSAFFRGPHLIPVERIINGISDDINIFNARCRQLGGTPLDFADASFLFKVTPSVPVAVLFWMGDADFKSEVRLMFDKTIEQHLPLDIIWALSVAMCGKFD